MIELSEDKSTLIVTQPAENKNTPGKVVQLVPAVKTKRKEALKKEKTKHDITPPPNCTMPPQPEAYLKCPRHDFL